MTGLKMLVAAALISAISPVSAGEGGPEVFRSIRIGMYTLASLRLRAGLAWSYRMAPRQAAT